MIGKNVLVSQNETVKDSASAKLPTTTVTTNQNTSPSDVSSISEQVLPSIVAIDVTAQTTTNTPFGAQTSEGTGSASGIIIAQKITKCTCDKQSCCRRSHFSYHLFLTMGAK